MLKRKKSALLLITIILTMLQMALTLFAGVVLIFNLFGVVDFLNKIIMETAKKLLQFPKTFGIVIVCKWWNGITVPISS